MPVNLISQRILVTYINCSPWFCFRNIVIFLFGSNPSLWYTWQGFLSQFRVSYFYPAP
jgi:hypothetical protein